MSAPSIMSNALLSITQRRRAYIVLCFVTSIGGDEEDVIDVGFTNRDLAIQRELFMYSMVRGGDRRSISQVRMSTYAFNQLCDLLKNKGLLQSTKYLTVDEQMAMFLHTLSHNVRNRSTGMYFCRSGETVHRHFHRCLRAVLGLHSDCVSGPDLGCHSKITSDPTLAPYFQGCVGAIDGTHIPVLPPSDNALAFRNRHGTPSQNVMAACDFNMKFTYILAGWEGSAHDAKVLQAALDWNANRFTIPEGRYYLVDAGYAHVPGFMAPYKGVSYHMSNYGHGRTPNNGQELFNFRHARLRTTIERLFAIWKKRFPVLQVATSYPYRVQV